MYIGWDSTTLDAVPADAHLVLPYNDGKFNNLEEARRRFPHAIIEPISALGHTPAAFLDIERFDATPSMFPAWHKMSRDHGFWRPGYYCNRSTWPSVQAVVKAAGIKREDYRIWIADPTGAVHIPAGADACQCIWKALGRNLDESVFLHDAVPPEHLRPTLNWLAEIELVTPTGEWKVRGVRRNTPPLG